MCLLPWGILFLRAPVDSTKEYVCVCIYMCLHLYLLQYLAIYIVNWRIQLQSNASKFIPIFQIFYWCETRLLGSIVCLSMWSVSCMKPVSLHGYLLLCKCTLFILVHARHKEPKLLAGSRPTKQLSCKLALPLVKTEGWLWAECEFRQQRARGTLFSVLETRGRKSNVVSQTFLETSSWIGLEVCFHDHTSS